MCSWPILADTEIPATLKLLDDSIPYTSKEEKFNVASARKLNYFASSKRKLEQANDVRQW